MIQKRLKNLIILLLFLLTAACGTQSSSTQSAATSTAADPAGNTPPAPETTGEPDSGGVGQSAEDIAATVAARTPVPTPTPSVLDQEINEITTELGIAGKTFMGLTADDWFNLAISVLIVIAGYFLGFKLLVWFLKWIARRTSRDYDGSMLKELSPDLKLLLLVIFTRFAVLRLEFLSDGMRTIADDIFFILALVLISVIAIRLINYSLNRYLGALDRKIDPDRIDPHIKTIQRVGDFSVIIIVGSIGVSHFGIGINALAVGLIIIGLILYLGARGIISDFVAGFIILIDQPIRVDDAVLITELDTWGIVLTIGTRTTRIRTQDNREVIIPNSQVNESYVVNYSYPDPKFRVKTDIGVAYGTDNDQMRKVIEETVRGVEGVLADQPVDILFLKFGDTSRLVRVHWWIGSYINEHKFKDKVNIALEAAFEEAGIEMPFDTYNLNVKLEGDNSKQTS